jgi:N-acyl-D-aspartate/D-glutamate deacylase
MVQMLIRGGLVVDGTGAPGRAADVRVEGDRIAEIAPGLAPRAGERVVDARDCLVTPGFIESHTHFDGTMWWQPDLDPLPGYGVTTAIMGNCGFSAAPLSADPRVRDEVVGIFSFFEDIPKEPFRGRLPWDWSRWSEYRASMEANLRVSAHYGAFVGHIPLRLAAMGMAAWDRAASDEEIAAMAALLEDALAAGAMGLSTNLFDHDGDGRYVPPLQADAAEWQALFAVLERHPACSLQVALDLFDRQNAADEIERLGRLLEGRRVRVQWAGGVPTLKFQETLAPRLIALHEASKRAGRDHWVGYGHVPVTSVINIQQSLIFAQSNDFVWHEVVTAEGDAAKRALLADPDWRARARHSWDHKASKFSPFGSPWKLLFLNSDNGVGPVGLSAVDYGRQLGLHPSDAMAEWFLANGLESTVHMAPFEMMDDVVAMLLADPMSVGNISDAPAHGQMMCGGGDNMLLFTYWLREKKAISVEQAVHVQTGKLARHFNLKDRGELAVGKRADITVFHLDEIERRPMDKVSDVPDGRGGHTWRWTRKPAPMRLTLAGGTPTFEEGRFTGALPGEMIGPQWRGNSD